MLIGYSETQMAGCRNQPQLCFGILKFLTPLFPDTLSDTPFPASNTWHSSQAFPPSRVERGQRPSLHKSPRGYCIEKRLGVRCLFTVELSRKFGIASLSMAVHLMNTFYSIIGPIIGTGITRGRDWHQFPWRFRRVFLQVKLNPSVRCGESARPPNGKTSSLTTAPTIDSTSRRGNSSFSSASAPALWPALHSRADLKVGATVNDTSAEPSHQVTRCKAPRYNENRSGATKPIPAQPTD